MEISFLLISGTIAALATYLLNNWLQMGGVMASAGISLLGSVVFYLFPDLISPNLTENLPFIIMGASFIGMASSRIIRKYWIIGISGFVFSLIYLVTGSFFEGFGGSLGTTAAISLASVYAIQQLKKRIPSFEKKFQESNE